MALSDKTLAIQADLQAVPRASLAAIGRKNNVSTAYVHKLKDKMSKLPARLSDVNLVDAMSNKNVDFVQQFAEERNVSFIQAIDYMITWHRECRKEWDARR